MEKQMENYKVTLPDESVRFIDLPTQSYTKSLYDNYINAAREVVWKSDIRTPWEDPKVIDVNVEFLTIKNGSLTVKGYKTIKVMPHRKEMTQEEYYDLVQTELKRLPVSFHKFVNDFLYEYSGDTRLSNWHKAESIISRLVDAIKEM